ncbi:MAG: hypothetical protein IK104_01210 [Clostridia bacterium]|nr:hypothetical protein [Clostridia bacterium]
MITKQDAKNMVEYYTALIAELTKAKLQLVQGGVKSYTIGDRSLTRFDLDNLGKEIEDALLKKAEYEAILNGRRPRKAFGVIVNG